VAEQSRTIGALRLLVVDDHASMRLLLRASLKALGIVRVAEAEDGRAALGALRSSPFDIVLLDNEMPVLSGLDTLREIRANAVWSTLPVIMVTGNANASLVRSIVALGAASFLIKPVSAVALGQRIESALLGTSAGGRDQAP